MNKFLYAVGLLGTVSQLAASADAVVSAAHEGPLSPHGYHGGKNGGMCNTAYRNCEALSTTIVTVRQLDEKGQVNGAERNFPVTSNTSVPEFKSDLISTLRIPAAHRIMWGSVEVMKENVDLNGELITLATVFEGLIGVPVLDVY